MSNRERSPLPSGPSRRGVLAGAGVLGLRALGLRAAGVGGLGLGGLGALAGCGSGAAGDAAASAAASDGDTVVRWASRPGFLDYDQETKTYPSLAQFERVVQVRPTYAEPITDAATYYASIQDGLGQHQDVGQDLLVLPDWLTAQMVTSGWAAKLDQAVIPNGANLQPELKNVSWDPGRNYSYPWQSGFTGLVWNVALLKRLTGKSSLRTLDDLWDERLRHWVVVQSEMRDTVGLLLRAQGVDVTDTARLTTDVWQKALAELAKHLASGQIRQVSGADYRVDLASGAVAAGIGWSGDVEQLNAAARRADPKLTEDPFGFDFPQSGGLRWTSNLVIPAGALHRTRAEELINYYYDPQTAAQVASRLRYITPVVGAQQAIRMLRGSDPTLVRNPFLFPQAEDLKSTAVFGPLTPAQTTSFTAAFQKVLGI